MLYRGKNAVFKFIRSVSKECDYYKSVIKKHFNKNLVMTVEENEKFEMTNICWICGKLISLDESIYHISGKYRGVAHWGCNINLKTSKEISVIFYNLKGYDSHLIYFKS